jgi:hypothetical protein
MSQFYSILPSYKKLSVIDHTAAICINTFHNLLVQITRSTSSPKALQAHVSIRQLSRRVTTNRSIRTRIALHVNTNQHDLQVTRDVVFEATLLET